MKIGFFTDSYLPSHDGVATTVETTARELQRLGHEVIIIAPSQLHTKDRKNVHRILSVRTLKNPEIWMGLDVPQPELFRVAQLDFDIIHGHSGGPISLMGWQLAKMHNIPFVETYHTLWKYYVHYFPLHLVNVWMMQQISKYSGNDCDAVITPTTKIKKELQKYGLTKPIYVLPSGLEIQKFDHQPSGYLHDTLRIPKEKKILLTVGRLEQEKSQDFLLKAFAHVHKTHSDTVFCLIGAGREKDNLEKLAKSLSIEDAVYFAGTIPFTSMPKIYADSELFLFASTSETQGMVINEALASGVPVIAISDEALIDSVKDGENGYFVHKNASEFAAKVLFLLDNKDQLKSFRVDAKAMSKNFSIDLTAKILLQIYEEIIYTKDVSGRNNMLITLVNTVLRPNKFKRLSKKYASLKRLLEEHV